MVEVETNGARAHVDAKWQAANAGAHYEGGRFRGPRARERDGRLLTKLVRRVAPEEGRGSRLEVACGRRVLDVPCGRRVLDVPCGTGRMVAPIRTAFGPDVRYVGVDVSAEMLGEVRDAGGALLRGSAFALPFPPKSFDAVVCCRFLHHHGRPAERESRRAALAELARVSRGWVFASYWDAASLRARQMARKARVGGTRTPCAWHELEEDLRAVGLRAEERVFSLRWVSAQTWVAAR